MNNSVVRAWEMFNSRAYLHQYEKYGLEVDDFIDSFGMVEQMISDYSKICKYWSTYIIGEIRQLDMSLTDETLAQQNYV